ncbi:ABC transporter substrate-binding protein [Mycoplasma wenyonii str. Massachusetts]|uniref:ABC transporter substrate-binding protein n=1 Tax=Mycoplasma wenyonii (strain Massachusetts) TaxID=1197325 RepID=I6ZJ14_MYCWM|nr:hypothetical protein [Mycoplasma wenyonii]AFN65200.1 ABC transporter substrate-binding protein [Mycoplasma wenyonii str. Massachusetts]
MYLSLWELLGFKTKTFDQRKKEVIKQLDEREWELRADWLSNSANFLSFSNDKKDINCSFFWTKQLKNIALFVGTLGFSKLFSLVRKRDTLSSIKELSSLNSRKKEVAEAKRYFQKIKDDEKNYEESKAKELEPWAEKIISYSLSSMPFSKHQEIVEKKNRDPYLRFLHLYSIAISCFFTGGLILFYFIYKKSRNPRYRFLDSALSKHVIEGARFEQYLTELVREKYEFDSITNLNHCLGNTFKDVALSSELQTNFLRKTWLRNIFLLVSSILTGGLFTLYLYWLSMRNNNEKFNEIWASKRVKEWNQIETIGNINTRTGRAVKAIRRFWTDIHILNHISYVTQLAIATVILKPLKGIGRGVYAVLSKRKSAVSFALMLITNTFLVAWSYFNSFDGLIYKQALSNFKGFSWTFFVTVACAGVTTLWFSYHRFLKKWWDKLLLKSTKAWADLLLSKSKVSKLTINTQYYRPSRGLNWGLFWMFTSPLAKWVINLFLLLVSYAFLLVWGINHSFAVGEWSFYPMVVCSALFILLLGYHIFLVI